MAQQIKFGDKLLLKGETLILDNGASHGEIKSNNGTIWIKGDLLIDGATTTINTEEINLADNNILINSNHTGTPTHDGGITINRGTSDDAVIQWNESNDKWEAKVGATYATVKADTFEGNSTGIHTGNVIGDVTGDVTGNVIGNLTGDVTGTVSSIANHDTDNLLEGSLNLYYTQARVDARYATLHANANADTLDNLDGTYYLDSTNFTNVPTTISSIANHSIDALSDVDTTTSAPSSGQVLKWTGSIWAPATDIDTIYTDFNTDFDTRLAGKSTTNLFEGANLYYTDARADARAQLKINALISGASAAFDTLVEIENAMATDTELTSAISGLNHDSLSGFVANEHIDWTQSGAGTIHTSNYTYTNTTYTAGTGISISGSNVISNTASAVDITGNILPATDNTYDLGSSAKKYKQIYGYTVEATFADLAERYATDVPYEVATVVVFGGEAEITTTTEPGDVSVAGVISTNPAIKMNAEAGNSQTHPYVALKGRVPCKLIGPVSKGDLIVTADNEPGYAQSIGKNDAGRSVFAKSIETDLTEGKKVIEVSIL
jgi:hypothetical protein